MSYSSQSSNSFAQKERDGELVSKVLTFWFGSEDFPQWERYESRFDLWWGASEEIDADIRKRFETNVEDALSGSLDHLMNSKDYPLKAELALLILLDQFPRNIYRGTGRAFAGDVKSKVIVENMLESKRWEELRESFSPIVRMSFLLPLMHQESLGDQIKCIELIQHMLEECKLAGSEAEETAKQLHNSLYFAQEHRDIIEKFGRFPHRNKALNRTSTEEERLFLQDGRTFGQ